MPIFTVVEGRMIEPRTPDIKLDQFYVVKANTTGYVLGPYTNQASADTAAAEKNDESGSAPPPPSAAPAPEPKKATESTEAVAPDTTQEATKAPVPEGSPLPSDEVDEEADDTNDVKKVNIKAKQDQMRSKYMPTPPGFKKKNNI